MRRLSIAAIGLLRSAPALAAAGRDRAGRRSRGPSPDDPTPPGIAYICEGRKEVAVVYAKNRASVTFGDKTWRTEYQPTGDGFRYVDTSDRMVGPRRSRRRCARAGTARPLAFNCRPTAADDVSQAH